jgi:hypothetical protein
MAAERRTIAIESIRRDATQTRAALNSERVSEYADRLKAGDAFPPPVVFFDGELHWLGDGFHRIEAHVTNGRARLECEVRKGGKADAILFGAAANTKHDKGGLYRSNADKRHAVRMVLGALGEKGEEWSDRRIADACGVGNALVGEVRHQLFESNSSRPRTGADGKTRLPPKPKRTVVPDRNDAPNVFVSIRDALRSAETEKEAGNAYGSITFAAADGALSQPEVEDLANEYREALKRLRSPAPTPPESDNDDVSDDDVEPVLVVGDEPAPVRHEPEPDPRAWGSFDVARAVNEIIVACRDFGERIAKQLGDVDPRFVAEVRQRSQDGILGLMRRLDGLLPPDGTRADDNRRRFGIVDGGKK